MGKPQGPVIEAGVGIVRRPKKPKVMPSQSVALTPEMMARDGSEHGHQSALIVWASQQEKKPGFEPLEWLHAVPNGGDRDRITAGRMKAEGVKSGVLDLFLPHARGGYFGLMIEMKKPEQRLSNGKQSPAGKLSSNQESYIKFIKAEGFAAVTCWTWEQARDVILLYFSWAPTAQQPKVVP